LDSPRGKPGNAEFAAAKVGLRMISRSIEPEPMSSIGEWLFCSTDEGESKCPSLLGTVFECTTSPSTTRSLRYSRRSSFLAGD